MFQYDDLGPMIFTAREELYMSQRQLAVFAETPLSHIARLEAGIPTPITLEQLLRVSHCVGLDMPVQHLPTARPTYDHLVEESRNYH
ncbi:helix-turn-helix domain-containing protein [Devosia sp. WQ 349]|uniref:helix-turn-helix domain-containing protein n=1 Tax=Devosia sp. WQ 349K1 TaxID=2800329 RepID=UPI001906470F|nr:helix-turn-helix transcriptional regulator [Devosia sp. WQ 349K1]MBK1792943.1 helix-turn-helix domain-containing protein [Devosia sp. WQ 349K1]